MGVFTHRRSDSDTYRRLCPVLGRGRAKHEPRPKQRGSALALSLLSVMLIASLGAGLMQLQKSIDRKLDFAVDRRRALYLAEAGIAEAALAVSSGRSGVIGSEAVPASFGKGVFWVDSDDLPDDRIVLRCTARVGHAELVIQSMILPGVNPVTSLGVFGSDGVSIGWGAIVDGYHSGRGDYASQLDPSAAVPSTGQHGLLGSDSDVSLEDDDLLTEPTPTHIYGRIRPGHDNHVISSGRPQLHGYVEAYESPPYLPEVSLPNPEEVISDEVIIADSQVDIGMTMATRVIGQVTVELGATLTLQGPKVLRCTALALDHGATLVLDDSRGPIHIYAEEGLDFGTGSIVQSIAPETTSRGTFVLILGSASVSDRVILGCSGTFHGAIYAPDDIVAVPKDLRWIGSIAARRVMVEPGAHITHDRRLALGSDGFPSLPRQLSWQLVPLGDQIARKISVEPLLSLAIQGVTPTPSSSASIEEIVELQYMDLYDQPMLYRGGLAAFDPKQASRIIGARWEDPRDLSMRAWTTPTGSESTRAIEALRGDLRELRTLVAASRTDLDVARLTDDESIEEAAALVTPANLALQPASVQRAAQRSDDSEPPVAPAPLSRAIRAANAARDIANNAQTRLAAADAYDPATLSQNAREALELLRKEVEKVLSKADDAEREADKAAVTTGKPLDKAASTAEKRALDAVKHFDKVTEEYDRFIDAL